MHRLQKKDRFVSLWVRDGSFFGELWLPGSAVCKLGWVFRLMHSLHSTSEVEKPWSDLLTHSSYWHCPSWERDHRGKGWKLILRLKFPQNLWIPVVGFLISSSPAISFHILQVLSVERTSFFQIKCYSSIFMSALLNFHLWTTCFYNLWQNILTAYENFWWTSYSDSTGNYLPFSTSCIFVQFFGSPALQPLFVQVLWFFKKEEVGSCSINPLYGFCS